MKSKIESLIKEAKAEQGKIIFDRSNPEPGRTMSLVTTKLEEALLWYQKHLEVTK